MKIFDQYEGKNLPDSLVMKCSEPWYFFPEATLYALPKRILNVGTIYCVLGPRSYECIMVMTDSGDIGWIGVRALTTDDPV